MKEKMKYAAAKMILWQAINWILSFICTIILASTSSFRVPIAFFLMLLLFVQCLLNLLGAAVPYAKAEDFGSDDNDEI